MPVEDWIQHCKVARFFYDWQTVIAGVLALVAAAGTIWVTRSMARKQIAASGEDARKVIAATREQTETTVRLERMRDAGRSVAAASEFQSAVHRCMSAIRAKESQRYGRPTPTRGITRGGSAPLTKLSA